MKLIDALEEFLRSNSVSSTLQGGTTLIVPPVSDSGFEVAILSEVEEFVVHYDGWHEHILDPDDARRCFLLGLTPQVRLHATYRGDRAYKWTLEHCVGDEWLEDTTVGSVFHPVWRKPIIKELQNSHLTFEQIKEFRNPI